MPFIIRDNRADGRVSYVSAPPNWAWTPTGLVRSPSVGAEHSPHYDRAYRFKSHRAATRVRNLDSLGGDILEV